MTTRNTNTNTNPEEVLMSLSRYDFAAIAGEYKAPEGTLPPGGRAVTVAWAWAIVCHYLAPNRDALARRQTLEAHSRRDVYAEAAEKADGFGKMSLKMLKATGILGDWSHFRDSSPEAVVDVAAYLVAIGGEAPAPGGLTEDAVEVARVVRGSRDQGTPAGMTARISARHDNAHTEMLRRAGVL